MRVEEMTHADKNLDLLALRKYMIDEQDNDS
jgi:hypothetical protein